MKLWGAEPKITKIRSHSDTLFLVFVRFGLVDGSSTDVIYMLENSGGGKKILGEVEDHMVCDRDKKGDSRLCD